MKYKNYALYKRIMKRNPEAIDEIETLEDAKEIIGLMTGNVYLHGEVYQLLNKLNLKKESEFIMNKAKEIKKVKFESYLTPDTHVHIQDGNRKVGKGIYTINLLAGDEPLTKLDGTQLTNISGTCGGCCENCKGDCYAIRTQVFRNNNMPSWADNTILATQEIDTFFTEIQQFIDRSMVAAIRFHAFGEIPSYTYLLYMVELAKNNPTVLFYTYTKRFEWVEKYLEEYKAFPNNLTINMSIWHKNYNNPYNLPEFIFDDGSEEDVAKLPHCPAVDKNGHETGMVCSKCKRCLRAKNGDKIAVYAH